MVPRLILLLAVLEEGDGQWQLRGNVRTPTVPATSPTVRNIAVFNVKPQPRLAMWTANAGTLDAREGLSNWTVSQTQRHR